MENGTELSQDPEDPEIIENNLKQGAEVLMVEVENVTHEDFKQTDEIKVFFFSARSFYT